MNSISLADNRNAMKYIQSNAVRVYIKYFLIEDTTLCSLHGYVFVER